MKKLYIVVGTRPNFIKITQFKKYSGNRFDIKIIHTGQHYDEKMSQIFFRQFRMQPDITIHLTTANVNAQLGEIMTRLEELFITDRPDCLMVVGDVNSTLAGALVANKMHIPLVHLESGLRSYDRTMPEEINRILTDELSDLYFVTEQSGVDNLLKEQKSLSDIRLVGNTMIDTMLAFDDDIDASSVMTDYKLTEQQFVLMTMHRPATVDSEEGLKKILALLQEINSVSAVFFPIHPRTRNKIRQYGLEEDFTALDNIVIAEPLDYFGFQKLIKSCSFIITDSGGIQEEATQRKVPCLTLRPNTERPVTITRGTNTLVSFDVKNILKLVDDVLNHRYKEGSIPDWWDGKASQRILDELDSWLK